MEELTLEQQLETLKLKNVQLQEEKAHLKKELEELQNAQDKWFTGYDGQGIMVYSTINAYNRMLIEQIQKIYECLNLSVTETQIRDEIQRRLETIYEDEKTKWICAARKDYEELREIRRKYNNG